MSTSALDTPNRELELREVVEERNLLIHHWLGEVDFDSVDECKELISRLDAQDGRLKPHYESLMRHLGHLQTAQNELRRLLEAELREFLQTEKILVDSVTNLIGYHPINILSTSSQQRMTANAERSKH